MKDDMHDTRKFLTDVSKMARAVLDGGACPGCVAKALACIAVTIAEGVAGVTADDFLAEIAREERAARADDHEGVLH
jgi:hypothetical protein